MISRLTGSTEPSADAVSLSQFMMNAVDVQRRILLETIEAAEAGHVVESGRTICPEGADPIRGPLGRFPMSVELQSCPVGASGIMHTHVTVDQLRAPEHSLPDVANVIFEGIGASLVAGTRRHDLLHAPSDPDQAVTDFQDALGLDVRSTEDVVAAIRQGRISDPADARSRVRSRLGGLFQTPRSGFQDLDERVTKLAQREALPARQPLNRICPAHTMSRPPESASSHPRGVSECCQHMRARRRSNEQIIWNAAQDAKINPIPLIVSSAIGALGADFIRSEIRRARRMG